MFRVHLNKFLIALIFPSVFFVSHCAELDDVTLALHLESQVHANPIVTQETHPILYHMVENLVASVKMPIPKVIRLYNARSHIVLDSGRMVDHTEYIGVTIDAFGDLRICRQALTQLTYQELEALVALAIAEKLYNVPTKLTVAFLSSLACTSYLIWKFYTRSGRSLTRDVMGDNPALSTARDSLCAALSLATLPAAVITGIVANNLQKGIDKKSLQLLSAQRIIAGIQARARLESLYVSDGFFSRVASVLGIRNLCKTLFYPLRPFTDDERVEYLSEEIA